MTAKVRTTGLKEQHASKVQKHDVKAEACYTRRNLDLPHAAFCKQSLQKGWAVTRQDPCCCA